MTYYSRRRVLKMVGVVTIASATGQLLPIPSLNAAEQAAPTQGLEEFTQVSQWLTAQDALNPTVTQALLIAFTQTDNTFLSRLSKLKTLLEDNPPLLKQDRLMFGDANADSEALARSILSSWYNGVVGKGFDAVYVTYVNNLANQLVSDKLVPPSFSYGEIGSWAQQP